MAKTTETSTVEVKPKKKSKKLLFAGIGCVALLLCGAVTAVASYFIFFSPDSVVKTQGKVDADNPQEEFEVALSDSIKLYLEDIDFEEFDKDSADEIFDLDRILSKSEEVEDKLRFLSNRDEEISGTTMEVAFDMSFDMGSDGNVNLTSDLVIEYPEFDYSQYSVEEGQNPFENLTEEEIIESLPKLNLSGNFNAELDGEEFSGEFDLTYVDEAAYFEISNLVVPESSSDSDSLLGAALMEDKVFKVDLSDYIAELVTSLKTQDFSELEASGFSTEDLAQEFNQSFEESLNELTSEDEEAVRRLGNPIKDIIIETFENFKVFSDVNEVDAIREDAGSDCFEGDVDFMGMIDSIEDATIRISELVTNDEAYDGSQTPEEAEEEIRDSMTELRQSIEDYNLSLKINLCSNSSDRYLTGGGLDLTMDSDALSSEFGSLGNGSVNVKVKFLVVNYDSDKEVVDPEFDIDLTDQLNDMQNSLLDNYSTDDYLQDDSFDDYLDEDFNYEDYLEEYDFEDYEF